MTLHSQMPFGSRTFSPDWDTGLRSVPQVHPSTSTSQSMTDKDKIQRLQIRLDEVQYQLEQAEMDAAYWQERAQDLQDQLSWYEHDRMTDQ